MAADKTLNGRVNVEVASGKRKGMGVPLAVGGTLDDPSVMLTRGAMVGAALGTLVAPGAGTAAGAAAGAATGDRIGDGLRSLFGGSKDK
jgi:hypothetical protein